MPTYLQCKDCTRIFEFSERESSFFAIQKWASPVRCKACRDKKKQRSGIYDGLYQTMNNKQIIKRRRARVHYAPHVVGGFR